MATSTWARIENGVVMELTNVNPADRYDPELTWVKATASVKQMDLYDSATGKFTAFVPPEPLEPVIELEEGIVPGQFIEDPIGPVPE